MAKVSVLGLGNMGAAIAAAFVSAGHSVTGWNRTPKACEFPVVESVADAISASDLLVMVVLDAEVARTLLNDHDLQGRGVVNFTTGTRADAEITAADVRKRGGHYLQGIIPAYPAGIGLSETALIYGGDSELWDKHAPTLRALGERSWCLGESPAGPPALDQAVTMGFYHSAIGSFVEAAVHAHSQGVGIRDVVTLAKDMVRVLDESIDTIADQIERDDFSTDQATIDVHEAAVALVVADMTIGTESRRSYLDVLLRDLHEAQADGRGEQSFAAMFPVLNR